MKRVGIFVDVSNLYYSLKEKFNGKKLNYTKFLAFIEDGFGEVVMKVAYGAAKEGQAITFKTVLSKLGFEIKYKLPKKFIVGLPCFKADQDVNIAMDIVKHIDSLDRIILASGDGDMVPVVEYALEHNVEVIIIASRISRELSNKATESIEIPESLLEGK